MLAHSSFAPSAIPASLPRGGRSVEGDRSLWQQSRCPADCQRPVLLLSWALAIAACCLVVGGAGLLRDVDAVHVFALDPAASKADELVLPAMLEMSAAPAQESAPSTEPVSAQAAEVLPVIEMLPPSQMTEPDVEELPLALTAEDLFEVPAAPALESMLTPDEAPKPTPKPAPKPSAQPRSTTPTRAASATTGGVPGGTGTSRSGAAKGYYPHPPYPAAARSRGMQGTVHLSVTFGSDGRVTGAAVARSSGYSELDRAASDWVRRHWRGAGGQTGTFRQPIQFRLR